MLAKIQYAQALFSFGFPLIRQQPRTKTHSQRDPRPPPKVIVADLHRGKNAGELRPEIEPEFAERRNLWRDLLPHTIAFGAVEQVLRRGIGQAGSQQTSIEPWGGRLD